METKHTNGPWKTLVGNLHHGGVEKLSFIDVMSARGNTIVRMKALNDSSDAVKFANANLIAAAPEMFDSLILMEMHLESQLSGMMRVLQPGEQGAFEAMLKVIKSTIAKAKGEL